MQVFGVLHQLSRPPVRKNEKGRHTKNAASEHDHLSFKKWPPNFDVT
jgi:hypothetical protein